MLSPMVNRIRLWLVDVASFLFCGILLPGNVDAPRNEAWVDGQVSNSMWSPPLAIPYVLMASGHDPALRADPAPDRDSPLQQAGTPMTVVGIGISYGGDLFAMFSGMADRVRAGRGPVLFMGIYMPARVASIRLTHNRLRGNGVDPLLSIPLFTSRAQLSANPRAGQGLYSALARWLIRVPGGTRRRQRCSHCSRSSQR